MALHREVKGEAHVMPIDLVLFLCLAASVTGLVIFFAWPHG
jgi:hypothetical protein